MKWKDEARSYFVLLGVFIIIIFYLFFSLRANFYSPLSLSRNCFLPFAAALIGLIVRRGFLVLLSCFSRYFNCARGV